MSNHKIVTVRDLIEKLQQFPQEMMLDIDASWYDRHNYNHAHRDIWKHNNRGIELCVMESDPGIVCISNMETDDVCFYEE